MPDIGPVETTRAEYFVNIWYRYPGNKSLCPERFDTLDDAIEDAQNGMTGYAYHETIWRKSDGTAEIIDVRDISYQRRAS